MASKLKFSEKVPVTGGDLVQELLREDRAAARALDVDRLLLGDDLDDLHLRRVELDRLVGRAVDVDLDAGDRGAAAVRVRELEVVLAGRELDEEDLAVLVRLALLGAADEDLRREHGGDVGHRQPFGLVDDREPELAGRERPRRR
jgi:hypothetical protein